MSEAHFKILLEAYLNESISAEDLPLFLNYLQQHLHHPQFTETIETALAERRFEGMTDASQREIMFQRIMLQAATVETATAAPSFNNKKLAITRWLSAAAILLIIAGGISFFILRSRFANTVAAVEKAAPSNEGDLPPGTAKAVLKLSDGTSVVLDDAAIGTIAREGNTVVEKHGKSELFYENNRSNISVPLFNTVFTPRGGEYSIVLPDGSKVWLNAESSISFPTAFTSRERVVTLTGEAYFEVAHNKQKPFKVKVNNTEVTVLGTHFNIMSYDNETATQTTLVEGSVKLTHNGNNNSDLILKPGQQAQLRKGEESFSTHSVDTDMVTAWKDGFFQFSGNDVQTIMRQIERWYDVEVHYAGKVSAGHYSGTVARNTSLLKVLKIFGETDLRFTIEGKKLTVL